MIALALLFLLVPIAEIYVIAKVAGGIGVPETILLLVVISVVGAWLTKAAGLGVLRRLQRTVRDGRVPSAELVDGALVLLAGALLLTPGFLSDCLAVLLLVPPTRSLARGAVLRRIRAGGGIVTLVTGGRIFGSSAGGSDPSLDVESWEMGTRPEPPAGSGRPELDR